MKTVEIDLELNPIYQDYHCKPTGPDDGIFICGEWVNRFFGVQDKKITVCFSDTSHIDSYFFRLRRTPQDSDYNNVTVYRGDSTRSLVLYGPDHYVYDELRDFVIKHFPSGQAFISIYVEAS
jgi:hypothetical protein